MYLYFYFSLISQKIKFFLNKALSLVADAISEIWSTCQILRKIGANMFEVIEHFMIFYTFGTQTHVVHVKDMKLYLSRV